MAYKPRDGMISPGTTVKTSYPVSIGDIPPVKSKENGYRAIFDIDGKKITIEPGPSRAPATSSPEAEQCAFDVQPKSWR
jgi:hypothetical protein